MPLIIPAKTLADSSYEISNSVRYNQDDSPELHFTPSSDMASRRTMTWSFWLKRGRLNASGGYMFVMALDDDGAGFNPVIRFNNSGAGNTLRWSGHNESTPLRFVTNIVFRDPSAWYHFVIMMDTTQSTNTNRLKLYINGTQTTDFDEVYYGSQNDDTNWGKGSRSHDIGFMDISSEQQTTKYFDGYLADFYYINAQNLTPSDFGETNDNGVWVPKKYTGTYNSDSFFLEFQQTGTSANSSGIGADTSGSGNHMTVANLASTDITTDTPTNNFCTVNPLMGADSSARFTFTEGNTVITQADNGNWRGVGSTFALTSGKWYWEVQNAASSSSNFRGFSGVIDASIDINNTTSYDLPAASLWYNWNNGEINTDGTYTTADYGGGSSGSPIAQGDTLGVLLNMDDDEIGFYKNGSALVTGYSLSSNISTAMPFFASGESADTFKINFGNPAHTISSGNADANGYGNFEYAVPSGYYALCTKNLAEFGG